MRKCYGGLKDLQEKENTSTAMATIRMVAADSVFAWYPDKGESGYIHYLPAEEYFIPDSLIKTGPLSTEKTAVLYDRLLVIKDFSKTSDLRDGWIAALGVSGDTIIFDEYGNFRLPHGEVEWTNLDRSVRLKVTLPTDFMPAGKAGKGQKVVK